MLLRDSITAADIPITSDLAAVAGYGDGLYKWSRADWDRFPAQVKLSIVVNAAHQGDVLDIENGDAVPADAPGWCDQFNRPGRRAPTLYCNRSTWSVVKAAIGNRKADFWISTLDGTTNVPGAVAVQYKGFGGYDESLILDSSWLGEQMDYNVIVKGWYAFPPINRNPAQSEVDYWVGRIKGGENSEAVMDAFIATAEYQTALQKLYNQGGTSYTDAEAIVAVAKKLSQ